jgi:hypothetical protein
MAESLRHKVSAGCGSILRGNRLTEGPRYCICDRQPSEGIRHVAVADCRPLPFDLSFSYRENYYHVSIGLRARQLAEGLTILQSVELSHNAITVLFSFKHKVVTHCHVEIR